MQQSSATPSEHVCAHHQVEVDEDAQVTYRGQQNIQKTQNIIEHWDESASCQKYNILVV